MAVQFQGDDGDVIRQLRQLKEQLDAGQISRQQYTTAYDQINRDIGVPCSRCRRPPAVIQDGARVLCAPCVRALAQAPRRQRRRPWLAVGTVAVVLALMVIYAIQIGAL